MADNCLNKKYKEFQPLFKRYGETIAEAIIRAISRQKGLPKGQFYAPSISEAKAFLKQVNENKLESALRGLEANPYLSLEGIKDYLQGVVTSFQGKFFIIKGNEVGGSIDDINSLEIFKPNFRIMEALEKKYPDIFKLQQTSRVNTVIVTITPRIKPTDTNKQIPLFAEQKNIIKPGVSELFESNPELANAVYEALGFETELPSVDNIIETENKQDKKEKLNKRRELVLREINAIEQLIKTNPDEITIYHSKPYKDAYEVIKYFDKNNWKKDDSKYKESKIITKPSYLHNHLEEELQKRIKNLQIINSSLFSDVEKVNYSNIFKEGKSYSSVEVLKYISDNKKDVLSGIAKTLIKYAEKNNVEIQIVKETPKKPAGAYFYSNKIEIYGNKNVTSHTLIHEIIHSFSSDYIRNNPKSLPVLQLENILKNILDKKILKEYSNFEGSYEDYATKNIHELLSEIISRPDILSHLALYDTNYNLITNAYKKETLLDKIIKILSDIFDFSKNEIETLSDLILFNARDIFEASTLWSEFNRNQLTPQQKQQSLQQYSQYLDTIFPDSKVKDIVYHGSSYGFKGENFDTSIMTNGRTQGDGVYFSTDRKAAERFAGISESMYEMFTAQEIQKYLKVAVVNAEKVINGNEVIVQPEQIHILGSKKDIEGFKEFVSKPVGKSNKFSEYISGKNSDSQTVLKKLKEGEGGLAAIAKQLLKSELNIPIEIVDVDSFDKENTPDEDWNKSLSDDFKAAGYWSPNKRKIFIAKNANVSNTAAFLTHEILHGYTNLYIYNNPNSAAVKNLDRLLKHLQTDKVQQMLTDKYPLTNIDELLVGIFTNQTFINDLKQLPPTNKNFKSIWEEILQIFRVIFGVTNITLFDEVFAASAMIVDESVSQMVEQEEFTETLPILAAPANNTQNIISRKLDELKAKVQNINNKYLVEGFDIEWLRPSQLAKSSIQKRQFGLKSQEQEDFEKLAQESGTILHNIQANIIKEAFPEYNQHIENFVIDEGMLGFEQALRKQLQPIINEAKSRNSILKAEVWVGNVKTTKGGTIDLLEITPEGNYYVYDLKTRFTEDVTPLRRYAKINEWSEQTLEYNNILKAGDSALGVVQGKVLGTYILELEVEIKPENKFNYNGTTKYKSLSAEKFLKRRELKNIKIVAPTFFQTGNRKLDATINKLKSQLLNMSKSKNISQDQRPAFNQVFESKLDLLQALQLKKDYNQFTQSGYIELAVIRKKLENKELTDSRFIKEQLQLYSTILALLDPPTEFREQFKRIQQEAQELQIMFEELAKDVVFESANETEVTKREGFGDDIFAPVKDVSWVFSQSMGIADVDNPIVQTVFRKTTTALERARQKVQDLGNMLMDVSKAYVKVTGDKSYSKLIENNHLVDEWKKQFYDEFKMAKNKKDFDWAKDNVTFNEKAYIEARDKQLDFHDTTTRDVYTNKLKLENPDVSKSEIDRLVEIEIAAQIKKWENSHKNAFTYFTPKQKWTNPKYTEIMNGPKEVKDMYLTLKGLLEYANEIMPEKVKKNFIPNFLKGYIERATDLGLLGSIKASWSGVFDGIEVTYDDEMMSEKDSITGEKLGTMWIPGISEIKNKSLDLPVVFFKFMEGVYRYEELKALEGLVINAKDILKKQQWLATDMLGNAISVDKTPARPNPASKTLAMMEGWIDHVYYNKTLKKDVAIEIKGNGFTELIGILKKGDSKRLSVGKIVDKAIRWTTLKNLGFSLYSPIVNLFGGTANMYMTGANGLYYSQADLTKAMGLALAGKTNLPDEDSKKAKLILEWLNIDSGEFIKKQEELLTNSVTKKLLADYNALTLMQTSESVLRNAGALAVIIGGKYNFNWDSFKVVDEKLVVEANDFQKSQLRQQIIKINRKNIGGISEDDMMLAKQYIVGRMFMQHRSWLPALFFERFGSKRYDYVLEKDIEGRYLTAFRLFKHLVGLSKLRDLSEMEQANLKSTRLEMGLLLGTGLLLQLLKAGLDDDDEKETWAKISNKIGSRVYSELLFFVDPTFESQYQILLSPAPVLGTAGDVGKFIGSIFKADDDDKRTKGPLQRGIKLTPLSKVDAFLTDLGINPIDEEKK